MLSTRTTGKHHDDVLLVLALAARSLVGPLRRVLALNVAAAAQTRTPAASESQLGPVAGVQLFVVFGKSRGDIVEILLPVGMLRDVVLKMTARLAKVMTGAGQEIAGLLAPDALIVECHRRPPRVCGANLRYFCVQ
jgi:hypothetical protein